jgi:hypothetical protein
MKLWIDDVRPAPEGYVWCETVMEAKASIEWFEESYETMYHQWQDNRASWEDVEFYKLTLIDIDHDAGEFVKYGGDYIKLLDWLEETGRNYPIRIHSMNPVGVENMRRIIERNNWREIK